MGQTTIRIEESIADRLHGRKERGESYNDVIKQLLNDTNNDD